MKLEFWYAPVTDLPTALAFYRDQLGWDEAWREGDTTVSFTVPGTDVLLMVDVTDKFPPGPMFTVDSLREFQAKHGDALQWPFPPFEIPGGLLGGFADTAGNVVYVMDQSTAEDTTP